MSLAALNREAAVVSTNLDTATRAAEFAAMCRLVLGAGGDVQLAHARAGSVSPRVETVLRAAVAAGTLSSAASLAEYRTLISSFLGSLANIGAFDRLLPDMKRLPLRTRTGLVTVGATAAVVNEGAVTPISQLALANLVLDPVRAVAIIAVSSDLAKLGGPEAAALFASELRRAVAVVTDQEFLSLVTAGVVATPSAGGSLANVWSDLHVAVAGVQTDSSSKLYLLTGPSTAKALALMPSNAGPPPFPGVTPSGGQVAGIPLIVCDAAAGKLVAIDASSVAAGSEGLVLDTSQEALLQMSSTPDNPVTASTVLTSLWQQNMTALKMERFFGAKLLRPSGAAVISGVSY